MKQVPLYEQIYHELKKQIETGKIVSGEKLPSEKELSEQYHVSRITSKKAMELLTEEGSVIRIPGKGSFVVDKALPHEAELREKEENSQKKLIGVVMDGFGPSFGCRMLEGMVRECSRQGYVMALRCSYGNVEEETRAIQELRDLNVAGILIMCVHEENYSTSILKMVVEHFPVVTVDRRLKGIPVSYVGTDNLSAAKEMTEYLLDRGYRNICFVKPDAAETSTVLERLNGVRLAYNERGLVVDESLWITNMRATMPRYFGKEQLESDVQMVTGFIREHPDIDSFFAIEYSMARIISHCLKDMGLEKKYPIVCFDSEENIVQEVMFSHVKQDEEQIGRTGIRMLADIIRGKEEVKVVQVPYQIVEADCQEK